MELSFIRNKLNIFFLKQVVNVCFHIKKMSRVYRGDNERGLRGFEVRLQSVGYFSVRKIPPCS